MLRPLGRAGAALVATALGLLASASPVGAHQRIEYGPSLSDKGRSIQIFGDQDNKPDDEITISYSRGTGSGGTDEYVITHDIIAPLPAGCTPVGEGPPWKEVRCSADLVDVITIEAGAGKNTIDTSGITKGGGPNIYVSINASDGSTKYIGNDGNENFVSGSGNDGVQTAGGNDHIDAGGGENNIEAGEGDDQVETGDGNQKVGLGGGDNKATLGDGNSKVTVGPGDNQVQLGDGNSVFNGPADIPVMRPALGLLIDPVTDTVSFGNGTSHYNGGPENDIATFGSGESVFSGGSGDDQATFSGGDNKFSGGEGNDSSSMGGGRDRFYGGGGEDWGFFGEGQDKGFGEAGKDRLLGGTGNDNLLGGPGFDRLLGGAGKADRCRAGGGGGVLKGCER